MKTLLTPRRKVPFPRTLIATQLKAVESDILKQIKAFDQSVAPYMEHICGAAGKRIRPTLALLTGNAFGGNVDDSRKIGIILELIHMATLVHDDIIDEARTRRNVPTPNAKWGNGMAVLLGDALFSHALSLATDFNSIDICKKVGLASKEVCQGEIIQTQRRFDLSLTKKDYFRIIEMKTGALFAAATGLSAQLAGADKETCEALWDYGLKLGTAYQIYDDCLDLVGSDEVVGKTLRTDLESGKLTLPILNLLESANATQRQKLNTKIINQEPLDLDVLAGIAEYEGAIEAALDTGFDILESARVDLAGVPKNKYKDALVEITAFLEGLLDECRR